MLIDDSANRRNLRSSLLTTAVSAAVVMSLGFVSPWLWSLVLLLPLLFWLMRRKTRRRMVAIRRPFPVQWEATLQANVVFFRALDESGKDRFRNLMKVFIDEVDITGVGTDVDETTTALVAASAVIPIFGFDDWEYAGLGEVLVYPSAYGENFSTDADADPRTLGMVGARHLSGVMILSKPDLISGFTNATDKRNVGIHEFSHLVDKADGSVDGLSPTMPADVSGPWIRWVASELKSESDRSDHINDYAYTNEAEYFAVLSEYFFEAPAILEKKDPKLYGMLKRIYHQNPKRLMSGVPKRRRRIGRNEKCPCGSGEKFKRCCLKRRRRGIASK